MFIAALLEITGKWRQPQNTQYATVLKNCDLFIQFKVVQTYCWAKEAGHKRIHTIWVHLLKFKKQVKPNITLMWKNYKTIEEVVPIKVRSVVFREVDAYVWTWGVLPLTPRAVISLFIYFSECKLYFPIQMDC